MPIEFDNYTAPADDTDGSSGGDSAAAARARQNYITSLKALLQTLGIVLTGNLQQLINQAATKGYSQATFMYYLRQTPEYRQEFRGIFDEDGTLKMSEQAYIAQKRQFEDLASMYGLRFSDRLAGLLFEGDVSVNEYRMKAAAVQTMKTNSVYLEQFNKVLIQRGIIDHKLSRAELQKFVIGEADKEWYKVWREVQTRGAAVMAGLSFAKPGTHPGNRDLRLPKDALKTLMAAGLTGTALQQAVNAIAENFLKTLPLSIAYGEGLNKQDIVKAIVGGKHSAAIQSKLERLLTTHAAFEDEERANPQMYATQPGSTTLLGASGKLPLTE